MSRITNEIAGDTVTCFGSRRDLVPETANCGRCPYRRSCLSLVQRVFESVAAGQLSANGYLIGERRYFHEQHRNACLYCGEEPVEEFPLSILSKHQKRVFPDRTPDEIQTARVFEELDDLTADTGCEDAADERVNEPVLTIQPAREEAEQRGTHKLYQGLDTTDTDAKFDRAEAHQTYSFPVPNSVNEYAALDSDGLEAEHNKLCQQTAARNPRPAPYLALRNRYCAASIEMNLRRLRPPRFRATCRGEKWIPGLAWSEDMKAMNNDMKIIDLHWLHCTGVRSTVKDDEFRDMFSQGEFDFEMASRFVAKNWKSETRVTRILLLADVEQWQLKKLASTVVNRRWNQMFSDARGVERQLKNAACRQSSLLASEVEDFTRLWIADSICGSTGQTLIGRVHGWLKGSKPLAPSTLSAKLKRMRRWTM